MSVNGSVLTRERSIARFEGESQREAPRDPRLRVREPLKLALRMPAASPSPVAPLAEASPRREAPAAWKSTRIAIKANGKVVLVDSAEILVVEAQGNYALLRQKNGSHLVREQISVLAEKLGLYGIIRIHRSVLVNAAHVEAVESLLTGEHLLRMRGGLEYRVTRTYKANLQLLSSTWIGG